MILHYLVILVLLTVGSFTLASVLCQALMLTRLVDRWYYRFGLEEPEPLAIANIEELAKRRQLRDFQLEDVITLGPEDYREVP